jgi:hypothetical protein
MTTASPNSRKRRPAAWRWLGRALLAAAIMTATAIAVSFLAEPMSWSNYLRSLTRVTFHRGAIVIDQDLSLIGTPQNFNARGDPLAWQWHREPGARNEHLYVNVPVWPVPLLLAGLGCSALLLARRGTTSATGGTRATLAGTALITCGLATGSIVLLSYACYGGLHNWGVVGPLENLLTWKWGADRGSAFWCSGHDMGRVMSRSSSVYSPRILGFWACGDPFTLGGPVWPLPPVLLTLGLLLCRRGARIRTRALLGLCPACGYPLSPGTGPHTCPECGQSHPHTHSEPPAIQPPAVSREVLRG